MVDLNAAFVHALVQLKAMYLLIHACLIPIQIKSITVNVIKVIQGHFVNDVPLVIMGIHPNQVLNSIQIQKS
jgi:hypothetical protein